LGSDASHHRRGLHLRYQQCSRFQEAVRARGIACRFAHHRPPGSPDRQRELFDALLEELGADAAIVNEVIEIELEDGQAVINRYDLPAAEAE
jgi:deoxyribodipyrimidine photolyase-like uncharacterized protein